MWKKRETLPSDGLQRRKQDVYHRALARLLSGQQLYLTDNGQWKFGGNKYIPQNVATRLPLEFSYTNNKGWKVYRADALSLQENDLKRKKAATPAGDG